MGVYEKLCNFSEKTLRIKPDPKRAEELQEAINITHLSITPAGAVSFFLPYAYVRNSLRLNVCLFSFPVYVFRPLFYNWRGFDDRPLGRMPESIANNWRLKASNQMVLSIFTQ